MVWSLKLGCKDGWMSDSVIKFSCEMNIRSIHDKEDSNVCVAQRAHHDESTWIRRGYYVDPLKTKFRRISTSFPRTFSM